MARSNMERRVFPRKDLDTKVIFEDEYGEGQIYLYAKNISLGGILLSADVPIKVGSYIFLSFRLPGVPEEIRATGQVVRVIKDESDEAFEGMGVRFVGLSNEAIDAIQRYCTI